VQLIREFPGARLAIVHRVGKLAVGDAAVVIAASAPHRAAAFDVCRAAWIGLRP
jgi:molybdopterin synthase catalytic subunit